MFLDRFSNKNLLIKFNKHMIYVSQGINSYERKDKFTLYSYSNTEYTSD